MIDMTHNTDNRRSLYHVLFVFIVLFQQFFDHIDLYFLLTDDVVIDRNVFSRLKINFLVDCDDLSLHEEFLHDSGRLQLHLICQILDRDCFRNCDHLDLFFYNFLFLFRLDKSACFIFVFQHCCIVIFVDMILFASLISFLTHAPLFIITMLFRLIHRCFRNISFTRLIFAESILRSAIASVRAVITCKRSVTTLTILSIAITLTTAIIIAVTVSVISLSVCSAAAVLWSSVAITLLSVSIIVISSSFCILRCTCLVISAAVISLLLICLYLLLLLPYLCFWLRLLICRLWLWCRCDCYRFDHRLWQRTIRLRCLCHTASAYTATVIAIALLSATAIIISVLCISCRISVSTLVSFSCHVAVVRIADKDNIFLFLRCFFCLCFRLSCLWLTFCLRLWLYFCLWCFRLTFCLWCFRLTFCLWCFRLAFCLWRFRLAFCLWRLCLFKVCPDCCNRFFIQAGITSFYFHTLGCQKALYIVI